MGRLNMLKMKSGVMNKTIYDVIVYKDCAFFEGVGILYFDNDLRLKVTVSKVHAEYYCHKVSLFFGDKLISENDFYFFEETPYFVNLVFKDCTRLAFCLGKDLKFENEYEGTMV